MTLMNGRFVMNTILNPKLVAGTTAALPAVTYANGTAGVGATLTANANGAFPSQDGVSVSVGQAILVKNQAAALQNGLYSLSDAGGVGTPFILTRHPYSDQKLEMLAGHIVVLSGGTAQKAHIYALQDDVATVGTDPVVYNDTDPASKTEATELFTLSGTDISNGFITLAHTPFVAANVHLFVVGGENQVYTDDYTVSGAVLTFAAPLAAILAAGMQLVVNYYY